jgi:DNA-binding response OmpR family regulator
MLKALLLEDDEVLSREIVRFLETKDIACDTVAEGDRFMSRFQGDVYDICLLDINVPGKTGLAVCREIRTTDQTTPILMLTAYGDIQDKSNAFTIGADDYLVKPFHFDELYLRIVSLLRRGAHPQGASEMIVIGDLEINATNMQVKRAGKLIELTPKEYQLLLLLARARGRTLSKQSIAEQIWEVVMDSNLNTVEVYINFLRKKMDRGFDQKLIHTRPGFGYYLKTEAE